MEWLNMYFIFKEDVVFFLDFTFPKMRLLKHALSFLTFCEN